MSKVLISLLSNCPTQKSQLIKMTKYKISKRQEQDVADEISNAKRYFVRLKASLLLVCIRDCVSYLRIEEVKKTPNVYPELTCADEEGFVWIEEALHTHQR